MTMSNIILSLLDSSHGPQEGGLYGRNGCSKEVEMQHVKTRLRRDGRCSSIARKVDKTGVSNEALGDGLSGIACGSA